MENAAAKRPRLSSICERIMAIVKSAIDSYCETLSSQHFMSNRASGIRIALLLLASQREPALNVHQKAVFSSQSQLLCIKIDIMVHLTYVCDFSYFISRHDYDNLQIIFANEEKRFSNYDL